MEPTKQQTVAFFAHVKAQKANKVRTVKTPSNASLISSLLADVLRLFRQEPNMGIGPIRYLHLSRLLQCSPKHGRAHLLCSVCNCKRTNHSQS